MLKRVAVDCSPEACQQTNTSFALDRRPAYPAHGPASHPALRPDRPSDYALLRINFGHLKHEPAANKLLSTRLGDEAML